MNNIFQLAKKKQNFFIEKQYFFIVYPLRYFISELEGISLVVNLYSQWLNIK